MISRSVVVALCAETLVGAFLTGALIDRQLHLREHEYGINQWGYRDTARAAKQPGELRVAVLGGSAAFETGATYAGTLSGQLFLLLRAAGASQRRYYSVVNLSEPGAGADSYADALRDYSYLEPDVVCIYDGYDLRSGVPPRGRRRSWVFRTTGYLPMLLDRVMGWPGWMSEPDGGIADVLEDGRGADVDVSCEGVSKTYCNEMSAVVQFGLDRGYAVMVASPPFVSSRHGRQQQSLAALLIDRFGTQPRFRYLDLGRAIDLSDPVNSPDGLHRTEIGNYVLGQHIARALLAWKAIEGATIR